MEETIEEKQHTAWIISVGNELLIGRIVNTNASWLAEQLTLLGYRIERIITVPDNEDDIAEEVGRGYTRAGIIITTGGLGPTYDDMTLSGVAKAFGLPLELNPDAESMVRDFYSSRGLELTEDRIKMAYLPRGAKPIRNTVGAAPGSLLEINNVLIISLPGVPSEMKAIFLEEVKPILKKRAPNKAVIECGIVTREVPESGLAPYLKKLAKKYPTVYLKSHPKGHELSSPILDIRVLTFSRTLQEAKELADKILSELEDYVLELGGEIRERHCRSQD
ncbi:MAG: nicotinamide mononucleotide deamidase-related protein [Desulfurococcales archaeon]|nr:nicotinamide mononucleotide deamidase-related protein [Desulfurococcales archaeon]